MNIDALADLLKSRGCRSVCYFHTDHFEPWSTSIDDTSARAIGRMANMARSSRYARRLSLFYSVFVPYRLESDSLGESVDERVPDDGIVFVPRSSRQEELSRETIRPLVTEDGHEMHLHVHHEFWTRNGSHFDNPVSRWVNAHSTPEADSQRVDLYFRLCKDAIAQEIGAPFDSWAFIHGNWALNASDPLICHVSDEMATIMRHGGFGDFSFPAGRSYCDPKLKTPFTCLPLALPRAYDDPRSDPRPIGANSRVVQADRFFIWNSALKSTESSLDYFSAANRKSLQMAERVVASWLNKSVVLGDDLFIKTHAHSMKTEYRLNETDSVIPHCYPDTVKVFECLERACERAGVELTFLTVNEVMERLAMLDNDANGISRFVQGSQRFHQSATGTESAVLPPATLTGVAAELTELHQAWIDGEGARFAADDLYLAKLAHNSPLESYELALATKIASIYPPGNTRIVEIGMGWAGLSILLSRLGFEVLPFEGNAIRYAAGRWHVNEQIRRFPALRGRLLPPRDGLFPEVFSDATLARNKTNLCIATNITHTYSAEHQKEIIEAASSFDELIIDLARFGETRNSQVERDTLLRAVTEQGFRPVERVIFQEPYEYWRFASRGRARGADKQVAAAIFPAFPLHGHQGLLFTDYGDKRLEECPVCHAHDFVPLWRMPATTLPQPIEVFGGYYNQVPTLQVPSLVYAFDFCRECESIFLNPVATGQKEEYRSSDHYIRKMQTAAEWHEYEQIYDRFGAWIPQGATVMLDAACGLGQYLHVARRRGTHHWRRLIGLELAKKYVEHMRNEGFEAHVFDIDNDDLQALVPSGSVDFISFCEAFEHVDRPLDALRKLLAVLRPGGRLFFTAQRYGTDVRAAVRPGEPIYIGTKLLEELPQRLGCQVINTTTSMMRYYIVLEK